MICVRTNRIMLGATLVALLITTTASVIRAETRQASEVSPNSTTNGTLTPELVPMSAPVTSEPKEVSSSPEIPASTARPANDADDPRAVINWLLDRSFRGR
jgi:hypothetical protein